MIRSHSVILVLILAPALTWAQAAGPAAKTSLGVSPQKSTSAQAKPSGKTSSKTATAAPSSRVQLHSAAVQVAAGIRAAEAALTPGELAIAQQVYRGVLPCELGASVTVEADERYPGYFTLSGKGFRYRMHPVETSTGAVRLEDKQAGAVWLQLANKSMLMNQKQGRRIADECANAEQVAMAATLKNNPPPALIDLSEPAKR